MKISADKSKPWDGIPMLWATSTIDNGAVMEAVSHDDFFGCFLDRGLMPVEKLQKFRALGFEAFQTDSDHLNTNEVKEGRWDWCLEDAHLKVAREAGGKWHFFAHFHVPPSWFRNKAEFVPMRCLEHGEAFPGWSIWHPGAVEFQEKGYGALRQQYGDVISVLLVGVHGDYGETEYPAGYRFDQEHTAKEWRKVLGDAHDDKGWWCADDFARADFRARMMAKYGALEDLNTAWGTDFKTEQGITYPLAVGQRRYWLDFVQWYLDSITRFSAAITRAARKHFPGTRTAWLLGGGEDPRNGQDQSGLAKAAAEVGGEIRSTHGSFQTFARNYGSMFKRIASACKFYGVPFWSEPPSVVSAEGTVGRIFETVSCGGIAYYDWTCNPLVPEVQKVYEEYGRYLTQEKPLVDVALFYPSSYHLLNGKEESPRRNYPERFAEAARDIREVVDFDILDERMIADGALDTYRVLVFLEGNVVEASTLGSVAGWIEKGGVAVTYDTGRVETVEGDAQPWREMFGVAGDLRATKESFSVREEHRASFRRLSDLNGLSPGQAYPQDDPAVRILAGSEQEAVLWAKALGEGWAIMFAGGWEARRAYYELLRDLVYHLSAFDPKKKDALAVDDRWDGVYSTFFEGGKVLFYNPTEETKSVDCCGAAIDLGPVSLRHVFLNGGEI